MRKFLLSFLILAALCGSAGAVGYEDVSGEGSGMLCGDSLTWVLDGSTLYISGTGDMYDFYNGAPWASYRYTIGQVVLSDGVTSVGAYAFQDYDYLTGVQFGNSLVSIGQDAFSSCDGLTSITLPSTFKKFGVNCLRSCTNLREIYCSGNFPRFDENSLWDTYATIYYSPANPWSVSLIQQLEEAFHGRIEFRSSDGTDPYVPTEATLPVATEPPVTAAQTAPTVPVSDEPIIFTRPEYTQATAPTIQTVPAQTQPQTVPTLPPQTVPETTRETILLADQYTQPAAEPPRSGTDGRSIFGLLIVLLTLTILATGSLLVRSTGRSKRRRRKKRRR